MADTISAEHRSWNMSRIRRHDSGPELRLRSLLLRAGFRFRLHAKDLPGNPDIIQPQYRPSSLFPAVSGTGMKDAGMPLPHTHHQGRVLAGEVWGNVDRDNRNRATLAAAAWTAMAVWKFELKAEAARIVQQLSTKIREAA